jgi:hypothetical protein
MDRPVPFESGVERRAPWSRPWAQVSALGDRTGPGAGVASASMSTAPQRSGLVLAWLILVAAIANFNRPVANVACAGLVEAP